MKAYVDSVPSGLFFPFISGLTTSMIDSQVLVFLITNLESQVVTLQTALDALEAVS